MTVPLNELFDQSENSISCDYYTPHEFKKLKIKGHDLFILHLNISSLSSHIDDLKIFFAFLDTKCDTICISESQLSNTHPVQQILILGCDIEHSPTESSAGRSLMYISQHLFYTVHQDLQIVIW